MLSDQPADGKEITLWDRLMRRGTDARREDSPRQFYPFWVDAATERIEAVGPPLAPSEDRLSVVAPTEGLVACWPIRSDGSEGRWKIGVDLAQEGVKDGTVRLGTFNRRTGQWSLSYLYRKQRERIARGEIDVLGRDEKGALILQHSDKIARETTPVTVWNRPSHNASAGGSNILRALLPGRKFPFPKSLYAVEDALRFFVLDKPEALVLDFFAGSGTTAHAVARLNKQDGGRRRTILVTNNEVSAEEQARLRKDGLRPGDANWESRGICEFITQPRLKAAVTGIDSDGKPIEASYRFVDEFPMSEGIEANVEFFKMTYEAPRTVAHHRSFEAVSPLLWLKAGSRGRRIEKASVDFDVADSYGVLFDLDYSHEFLEAIAKADSVRMAFIVTEDDRAYQMVCAELSHDVEPVRLYESYLSNFAINSGRD